ncbi:MAG: GNAT family N-acetyltransferase [Flavobacteriales bacterium]
MHSTDKKLFLRTPLPDDLELMLEIENNPANKEFSKQEHRDYGHEEMLAFILSNHDLKMHGQIRYTAVADQNPIGFFDLYDADFIGLKAGIGLIVHPNYQHMGLGTLALSELENIAHLEHGLRKLYAVVDKDNVTAIRFFRKMAYRSAIPEGDVQIFPKSVYLEKNL